METLLIKFWKPIALVLVGFISLLGVYIVGRKDGSKKAELKHKDEEILTRDEIIKKVEESSRKENEIKELYDKASDLVDDSTDDAK